MNDKRRYFMSLASLIMAVTVIVAYCVQTLTFASTVPTTVRPINTGAVTGWVGTGTPGGSCTGLCDYVDEASTDGDTSYMNGPAASGPSAQFGIGGSGVSGQTVTSVVVHVVGRAANGSILGYPPITVSLTVGASTISAPTITFNSTTYQDLTATFTGTWSKSAFDTASVTIVKGTNGLQPAVRITTVSADIIWRSPDQNQNATRTYLNTDTTTPGAPLAATNAVAEVSKNTAFRLRTGLTVSDYQWDTGSWGLHGNTYKLQYALKTAGSCSAQASGWGDVSGASTVQWNDNPSVTDGTTIGAYANDPTTSGTKTYQTYRESNTFTNPNAVTIGNTALWDFSLKSVNPTPGDSYCFRIVMSNNTVLQAYSSYPEILITGDYSPLIVDAAGAEVVAPLVPFSSATVATTQCALSSATLGVSSQKLRITNDLVTNGWNVSIAATSGPGALWTAGASKYDFNDPTGSPGGCQDGADGDAYAGQLRINPSVSTITPKSGCATTGVSKGSDIKFSQGITDAITIASANATSSRFCYWDITSVPLEQRIPPQTPAGAYSMDMTITMTAL